MNTSSPRLVHIAAVFAAAILFSAGTVSAQEQPPLRTVSVSGEGIVRAEPDMATVRFGIVTVADDPETAQQQNADASARAMNAVRDLGIEDRYIQLENLRLQPHREWVDDERRYVEQGYEAARQVVVEVHDLEMLPILIAEIVDEGANRLNQVQYDLDDRDRARNGALREAVANAREKASLLAESLGEELGQVQSISEQSFDFPQPVYRAEMMQMDASGAAEPDAFAAGELEVRATVHATFVLD